MDPNLSEADRKKILAEEIVKTQDRTALRIGLPFLYGFKWYEWAKKFFDSKEKICLLTAANQISKSSTQIRKCTNWATDKDLWPELWVTTPNLFWYLYPTQDVINIEFETKWKQFLPRGIYKDDPYYGWEVIRSGKDIAGIAFKSGVTVLFKTYGQNVHALQSSTVYAMFCDEELPIDLFDELIFRLTATDGYFSMVFTATRGQDEWRRAMEPGAHEIEFLPEAHKQTVSMYDCQFYEDGSQAPWTLDRIREKEMRCSSHNEILKRIHGRFILDEGSLKYESFDHKRHIKEKHPVPKGWYVYVGIDIGSGGAKGHPSAICYVAVKPDFTEGRIFAGWRGDKIITTAGDVMEKNIELKKKMNIRPTRQFYDWGSKDFFTIASRNGEAFEPAEKGHDFGEDLINTLFKNDMLFIYRDDELTKLTIELGSIRKDSNKKHAKDDFIDAMRYAVSKIPWDFTNLSKKYENAPVEEPDLGPDEESRKKRKDYWDGERERIEDEFDEWNELY